MFTGLVECTGTVVSLVERGDQARLTIHAPFAAEVALGDSVAVNGCCLTLAAGDASDMHFDLLMQTLTVTSLGGLAAGSQVNLERAMRVGDRFGGHFVLGHVDATGEITALESHGQDHRVDVRLPADLLPLCIDKGSLAIDGISLTIADLKNDTATFWITPHTWENTNLHAAVIGSRVNLESDMLAKHVARLMDARLAAIAP
ncbi:MAG: riboflavin synthase [Luteolibacter sp.]|jgi:riboflavin synthase